LIKKQSIRVGVWDVEYEGILYRVVYDKNRKQIITVIFGKEVIEK